MSPGPQTDLSGEPGTEQEPRAVVLIPGNSVEEDGPKQTNLDEDMLGVTTESNRDTDGESSRARAAIRISDRGKQRADLVSPCTVDSDEVDMMDIEDNSMRWAEDSGLAGMGYEYSQVRVIPSSPSSFLRPGSRFTGTQQSERQRYDVKVEIKHVDLRESFLCGYLKIQGALEKHTFLEILLYDANTGRIGLTEEHPTLTTYFEGEIIGPKYGFITQHPNWGATDKIDLSHWAKFPAFRPFQKQARKGGHVPGDMAGRECIFMRWKEHFLVPDHRVRTIIGASFEGFYYICFNQMRGEISGIYFHSRSEK
jgi:hypothetical protein